MPFFSVPQKSYLQKINVASFGLFWVCDRQNIVCNTFVSSLWGQLYENKKDWMLCNQSHNWPVFGCFMSHITMISLITWRTINYCKLCNSWRISKLNPQKHFQANFLKIFFLRISRLPVALLTTRYKFELALKFSVNIMMLRENWGDINYRKRGGEFCENTFLRTIR